MLILDLLIGEKAKLYDQKTGEQIGEVLICRPMEPVPGRVSVGFNFPRKIQILRDELTRKEK